MMIMYYIATVWVEIINYIFEYVDFPKKTSGFQIPRKYLIIIGVMIAFVMIGVIFHLLEKHKKP